MRGYLQWIVSPPHWPLRRTGSAQQNGGLGHRPSIREERVGLLLKHYKGLMLRALEANKLAAAAVPCPASDSDEKPVGAVCTLDPGWSYEEACLEWHVQQLCDDGYTEAAEEFPLAAAASPEDLFVHASCVEDPGDTAEIAVMELQKIEPQQLLANLDWDDEDVDRLQHYVDYLKERVELLEQDQGVAAEFCRKRSLALHTTLWRWRFHLRMRTALNAWAGFVSKHADVFDIATPTNLTDPSTEAQAYTRHGVVAVGEFHKLRRSALLATQHLASQREHEPLRVPDEYYANATSIYADTFDHERQPP